MVYTEWQEEGVMMDKKKALENALAQIEKAYGKGSVMRLGENTAMNVEAISTGSVALDIALGIGGVPRGRIVEVYGPESSGKTTLALHIAASAQKAGGEAAFIDAEHALDPVYAKALGVDVANRRWKLPRLWCAAAPSTWLWWTRWPLWCQRRRSKAKWATPLWAFTPG